MQGRDRLECSDRARVRLDGAINLAIAWKSAQLVRDAEVSNIVDIISRQPPVRISAEHGVRHIKQHTGHFGGTGAT